MIFYKWTVAKGAQRAVERFEDLVGPQQLR
jgi:hypothetical protein